MIAQAKSDSANEDSDIADQDPGKKSIDCVSRDGRFKGETIRVPEKFICDNTLQCAGGEDELNCKEEYIVKRIFTVSERFTCPWPYLNVTRPDNSSGKFFPYRGIPCDTFDQCPGGEDEDGCQLPPLVKHTLRE